MKVHTSTVYDFPQHVQQSVNSVNIVREHQASATLTRPEARQDKKNSKYPLVNPAEASFSLSHPHQIIHAFT
jgi:hypothetical protein